MLMAGKSTVMSKEWKSLSKFLKFGSDPMSIERFLGIHCHQNKIGEFGHELFLSQSDYINKVIARIAFFWRCEIGSIGNVCEFVFPLIVLYCVMFC